MIRVTYYFKDVEDLGSVSNFFHDRVEADEWIRNNRSLIWLSDIIDNGKSIFHPDLKECTDCHDPVEEDIVGSFEYEAIQMNRKA